MAKLSDITNYFRNFVSGKHYGTSFCLQSITKIQYFITNDLIPNHLHFTTLTLFNTNPSDK